MARNIIFLTQLKSQGILIFKSSRGYLIVNNSIVLASKFVDFALGFSAYICRPLARKGAFQGEQVRWVSG